MLVKVSEYIESFLYNNGITDVFTVTGGGAMHLNDAFGHSKHIRCIYNHHEQACAIAAEAYARLTNKLPVVCVTSGPGGTNALTGVIGAYLDSIPMFVISGQVKIETTIHSTNLKLRQLGDQEFNISETVKNMTKYSKIVLDKNKISYYLEKALFLCKNGRPAPVWLDIPLDIQSAMIDIDNLEHYDSKNDYIDYNFSDDIIEKVYNKIKESKRPVILSGSAIRISNSYDKFLKFIDKLQIPVLTAFNCHDLLEDSHFLYAGRPGTVGTRGGNFIIQNCDLLISLGCRMNIRQISYNYKDFAKNAYKIYIDIDKSELEKPTLNIDMPINTDISLFFDKMNNYNYVSDNRHRKWLEKCKYINSKYPAVIQKYYLNKKCLNPYVFMDLLFKILKKNDIIITGNGSACVISFQCAIIKKGQRLFSNSGCASMGYGLPASIGACISKNNSQRIICIEGDGSVMMNLQELQTVYHNKLNIKIIILNNNGYHSIRQTQSNLFKPPLCGVDSDSGVSFPNFEKIAYAFDIPYVKVDNIDNAEINIKTALESDTAYIIEAILDDKQFFEPKLSSKVNEDGSITSPSLDDMYPFLDKSEYEEVIAYLKG